MYLYSYFDTKGQGEHTKIQTVNSYRHIILYFFNKILSLHIAYLFILYTNELKYILFKNYQKNSYVLSY